ncbi:alpha/beta hydrolase family protein [Gordonia sp. (in: high G+C Gram-positive bacteria)]|uniref:alpha/beta hydrolase n=1 Tax=Gordonia sp. (in: high G+C Gram-positive bacteria) TaxID=84139 RepID=UPI00169D025E|nr:alpha/beta hydrolase family protein [Gordonia sp. (in: high G+C Gram-positive bacteria)]NLG45070.1 esterase family protein [Gordonia sp. (in: high G+C Gram-positive bacteria)]
MRVAKSKRHAGSRKVTAVLIAALTVLGLMGTAVGAGQSSGATRANFQIDACGMPTNGAFGNKSMRPGIVNVQAWRKRGNTRTVILLDGMRARYDRSGWDIETNARRLADRGVDVVMPVGGPNSFYTDWDAPSNFNGQKKRYRWGCVIDNRLVPKMRELGFPGKNRKYAIMGLSMGGGAALTHAAQRRDLYYAAGSMSGYLTLSAPGMRTALRMAMLDVAPAPWNIDAMWGPPWSPRWTANDPFMLINRMRGLKVFVGTGNGFFGHHNRPGNVVDDFFKGTPLELLAFAQAKAFEAAAFVQGVPVMSYTANGTHAWGYWQDMLWNAHARGFFR